MKENNMFRDPLLVSRVQTYLAENVDKKYIDVGRMAKSLMERYVEYSRRKQQPFLLMVDKAYEVVLQSYGLDDEDISEGSEDSDLELVEEPSDPMNDRLLAMYNMQRGKSTDKSEPPAKYQRRDEESTNSKLRKRNDTPQYHSSDNVTNKTMAKTFTLKGDVQSSDESKSDRKIGTVMPVKVTLMDIGGISDIVTQICDLVQHMKHPEVYTCLGIKYPRGALLHGPPGTGKTLLAQAIAGTLKLPFISMSGTELVGGLSGESEERIRDVFDRASSMAPSILFIDEIDSICSNRANAQKDMEKRMVSQLLASLDSLNLNNISTLVLAATSNPDALDPALRREGRLEQEIALGIPTFTARKEILGVLCKNITMADDIDMNVLVEKTPGFVGADLQALVTKASTYGVKRIFAELKAAKETALIEEQLDNFKSTTEGDEIPNEDTNKGTQKSAANYLCDAKDDDAKVISQAEHIKIVAPNDIKPTKTENNVIKPISKEFDALNLIVNTTPYTKEALDGIQMAIKQVDFIEALKTTKPCAVREGIITVPDVTWEDVGSLNQVRDDLQLTVLAPIKYPEQCKELGLSASSGVLLWGPPGCGKTLVAKAVANETRVNFISVKGPELLNMYVGESERAVRMCFRRARNSAPCVIFFDEFDALCPRRSEGDNSGAAKSVVNQLLTEMDGIESREGVFILAATNRPDMIDPAVLRPGRLDNKIYIGMPTQVDRVDILKKITKGGTEPRLGPDVDLHVIASLTERYTGADLYGLVRCAATNCLMDGISNDTILDGKLSVSFENFKAALAKCKPSVSPKEQLRYEKLRSQFAPKVDLEIMDTNEESMDTV